MGPDLPRNSLTSGEGATGPGTHEATGRRSRGEARVGLYVHVPFCAVRCAYCDFATGPLRADRVERYLDTIDRECARRAEDAADVLFSSVFFGGGTPSALSARQFARLSESLRSRFRIAADAEITLEANPESVRDDRLEAWAAGGVNRLSFGAQSFVPDELVRLGRAHPAERPAAAIDAARRVGFRRLSVDLMFGFPGHDARAWSFTLDRALELGTENVSAYCYIPEADTPMGNAVLGDEVALPEPEAQADLYEQLTTRMAEGGLDAYEISNFSRPGGEARHNLVYWLRRDYLGVGPSAHGLWKGLRRANPRSLEAWASGVDSYGAWDQPESIDEDAASDEIVMLGLRLSGGLDPDDYSDPDWAAVKRCYTGAIRDAIAGGRLVRRGRGVAIPAQLRFLSDDVVAWLMARARPAGFDSDSRASVTSRTCRSPHTPERYAGTIPS